MRILCGKFSKPENRTDLCLLLLFIQYSKDPCGECPSKKTHAVSVPPRIPPRIFI